MCENFVPTDVFANVFKFGSIPNKILKSFYCRTENHGLDVKEIGAAEDMYIAWKNVDNKQMLLYEKRFFRYPLLNGAFDNK